MTPPADWRAFVNRRESASELEALRLAVGRGRPFGGAAWIEDAVSRFDLGSTLRPRGRPKTRRQEQKGS